MAAEAFKDQHLIRVISVLTSEARPFQACCCDSGVTERLHRPGHCVW